MANNRMFLVYRPTGDCVFLGKRMSLGWYDVPADIKERIERLFAIAEESMTVDCFSQDDFAIAMESGKNQPYVIDKWKYTNNKDKLEISLEVPYGTDEKV